MEHTLVARILNDPAALTRLVSLLRRRGFDIQSLAVERPDDDRTRLATFVVQAPDAWRVRAQLMRLVDVLEVTVHAAAADEQPCVASA